MSLEVKHSVNIILSPNPKLVLLLVRQGLDAVTLRFLLSIPSLSDIIGNIIWNDCSQLEFPEEFTYEGILVDRCASLLSYVHCYLECPDSNSTLSACIASAIPSLLFRIYSCITVFHHVKLLADLETHRRAIMLLLSKRYHRSFKSLIWMASNAATSADGKRIAHRSIGLQRLVESINAFEYELLAVAPAEHLL
jgi:hypothetical protein